MQQVVGMQREEDREKPGRINLPVIRLFNIVLLLLRAMPIINIDGYHASCMWVKKDLFFQFTLM